MARHVNLVQLPEVNPDVEVGASLNKEWEIWLGEFEMYFVASGIVDTRQIRAMLLYCAGKRLGEIFYTIPDSGEVNDYNTAKTKLQDYFKSEKKHEIRSL